MKNKVYTEAEIQAMNLRDPGEYDFAVVDATEERSKSGNEMVKLKLQLEDKEGRNFTIFDYLVSTENMAYKLRHFARSVGLMEKYEAGDMAAEYMTGRVGKCKVGVKAATSEYPAKNVISDYLGTADPEAPAPKELLDDEIPF